ncbi:MAG: GLPGLI family protein [Bacteroides sp.]|nr:GLPGLI family protein [Bacteroides sp.]
MKKLILTTIASLSLSATAVGAGHSTATLRAEYNYESAIPRTDTIRYISDRLALQIAPDESRCFSIKTAFFDSISATPGGPELIRQQVTDALNNSGGIKRDAQGNITEIKVDHGVLDNVPRRATTFNVYKSPLTGSITVIDMPGGPDNIYLRYTVPMDDLTWEAGDSTATILGYECQNATATYHGRRWTAWFAPDIPVSDGPWQLYGLPGLIMMAESDGGEYRFTITALYECNEPIIDIPGDPVIEDVDRKEFLRTASDIRRHPGKAFGITNTDSPCFHDLLETDYK